MEDQIEEWIEKCEENKEKIKKLSPKDRLEMCAAIMKCNFAINSSTLGWKSWLSSPAVMEKFTEDELKDVFKSMQKLAKDFIELDIKYTKVFKTKKKKKTRRKKKLTYLA